MNTKELQLRAAIQREAEKRLITQSFFSFCMYMDREFFIGKRHTKQVADIFQQVADEKIKKVYVSMPPRAGKSYITSLFCAWMIGKHPTQCIMRNSHTATLAEKFSYDIRQIIQSDKYLDIFPNVKLRKDKRSVEDWAIEGSKQSTYFCAGVGGSITGKGADLVSILDDPIKDIETALSETYIQSLWRWYTGVHLARAEKDCPQIHIATRWSKKDPIGRLTDPNSEFCDNEYQGIVIAALDEQGQSFCESVKSTKEYYDIRRITDPFIWEAEFMQNPIEEKGLLFPMSELNTFTIDELRDKEPEAVIGYTDTADQGTDFLCSVVGKKYGDFTYITDVLFTQEGVEVTEPLTAKLMIDTKCKMMNVESNAGGKSFADNVQSIFTDIIKELKNGISLEERQKAAELQGY